jgi:hypothetical protein
MKKLFKNDMFFEYINYDYRDNISHEDVLKFMSSGTMFSIEMIDIITRQDNNWTNELIHLGK